VNFNQDKYKRTGWTASIINLEVDSFNPRLIIRVATGRKYWTLFTEVISTELGVQDPAISKLNQQLYGYTHPMIDRFIQEIEVMLQDIYNTEIKLVKPKNHLYDIKTITHD
jgi:hypothetical protein